MARNSSISVTQLLERESGDESRLFIGPMPIAIAKKNAPQIDNANYYWWSRFIKRSRRVNGEESGDQVGEEDIPDTEALRFFMYKGGKKEAWSSNALRKSVKRDMLRRLQQSEWTNLFRPKNVQMQPQKWIGTTFMIGKDFLGLPLEHSPSSPKDVSPVSPQEPVESNIFSPISEDPENSPEEIRNSNTLSTSSVNNITPVPNSSTAALIQPSLPTQGESSSTDRPATRDPSTSLPFSATLKSAFGGISPQTSPLRSTYRRPEATENSDIGKSIQFVHYPEPTFQGEVSSQFSASMPHACLESSASQRHHVRDCGEVIRRERLLVRKGYTKSGHVGRSFGANEALKLRDLQSQVWKEFLVVWRKHQLELYEDYSIAIKEKLLGHKHLVFVIPLDPTKTRLSLYSFVDLTFCLSCSELTRNKYPAYKSITNLLNPGSPGTHIFVFKAKIRTSGIDWLWSLWKQLNYKLPRTIEIHCPPLQAFVQLRIPENPSISPNDALFSAGNVIERCHKRLKAIPSWDLLIGRHLEKGAVLQLCWRNEAVLDWVQWETDLIGGPRDASVLYGLCLKRPHETTRLELRIGEHRSAYVVKDSEKIFEPPPIEGYVYCIKLRTHSRILLYLSVHSGCLFFISPAKAYPPKPPLPVVEAAEANNSGQDNKVRGEQRRGALQVFFSDAFIDLRKVSIVRRTATPVPVDFRDGLDVGGEEGFKLYPAIPRIVLRLRRSFELLLENNTVIRFETHSCVIVEQWVNQLNRLVEFWKQRRHEDTTQEIKILDKFSYKKNIHYSPGSLQLPSVKPDDLSEDISMFWSRWGVYDCQSITLAGRLFVKRKAQGQYSLMQFVLIPGHVVQFDVSSSLQNPRSKTISLLDAYVCSGHFATQSLSVDEFSTIEPSLSRRFQDGLEIEDRELELVFIIWFRPHVAKKTLMDGHKASVPAINAKHKIIVAKARSKLERDFWCGALNDEIEQTARRHVSRELQSQEGSLMNI